MVGGLPIWASVFDDHVQQALHAAKLIGNQFQIRIGEFGIPPALGQELQEGFHRHQRVSNLMCDLGAERSDRGEAIRQVDVEIGSLDPCHRESGRNGRLQPMGFSLELAENARPRCLRTEQQHGNGFADFARNRNRDRETMAPTDCDQIRRALQPRHPSKFRKASKI